MAPPITRPLASALLLSLAVHAALLIAIQAEPPRMGPATAATLRARLEYRPNHGIERDRNEPQVALPPVEPEPAIAQAETVAEPREARAPDGEHATAASSEPLATVQPKDAASGLSLPLMRDPSYYPVGALDRPPTPLASPEACYPQGATGEVAYLLLIDEAGMVDQASVVAVAPQGLFTAAAAEMCRKLKFSPALKDGRAVRSRVRFVVGPG